MILAVRRRRLALSLIPLFYLCFLASCQQRDSLFCCSNAESCAAAGNGDKIVGCESAALPVCNDDVHTCEAAKGCLSDNECKDQPNAPFCVDRLCRECNVSTSCKTPSEPVCDNASHSCTGCTAENDCARFEGAIHCGQDGTCVGCRDSNDCGGDKPTCDTVTATCRVCKIDDDCPSKVCASSAGTCADADKIIYITNDGADAGLCTLENKCRSFSRALEVAQREPSRDIIKVLPGEYAERLTISNINVTILGNGAVLKSPGTVVGPVLIIKGPITVSIEGLEISGAVGAASIAHGIHCKLDDARNAPTLRLHRVRLLNNAGQGILAEECTEVTIEQSVVAKNKDGGILIKKNSAILTNNMIFDNNGEFFGGAKFDSVANLVFDFNTVIDNTSPGTDDKPAGIDCKPGPNIILKNNIIFGDIANQADVGSCSFSYLISNETGLPGNNILPPVNQDFKKLFLNYNTRDLRLKAGNPAIDAADPAATLNVDFEGQERPQPKGGRSDIGADELTP